MKILLTGATGFLGSHIADAALDNGYEMIIIKRRESSLLNCCTFIDKVQTVDVEDSDWIARVCELEPDIIIHAAWSGVASENRENWTSQLSNILLTNQLLYIAESCQIDKFIALGSQAEYGEFSTIVSESSPLNPVTKYGCLKTAISVQISSFCELRTINWYWLRVFSVFGERESLEWLFPATISRMLKGDTEKNFTLCEQKYAYLYVKDLAQSILKVCKSQGRSGIYNLSSSYPIALNQLLSIIREKINPKFKLNFGALPYREKQSMHIEGDSTKFIEEFGEFESHSFENVIDQVINYYRKRL